MKIVFIVLGVIVIGAGTWFSTFSADTYSRAANITLSLTPDKTSAAVGDKITYTITYTNIGNAAALYAKLSLNISTGLAPIPGGMSNNGAVVGNTVVWNLSLINPGATGQQTAAFTVTNVPFVPPTTTITPTPTVPPTSTATPTITPTISPAPSPSIPPVASGNIDKSCNPGSGTDYQVGPGKQYTTIGSVPWKAIKAGDSIRVFWRQEPYREKVYLLRSGAEGKPITFCGVPGPNGELPILDGENATTSANFDPQKPNQFDSAGLIVSTLAVDDSYANGQTKYWNIKNFDIRNAHKNYAFTNAQGVSANYQGAASGIYIYRAAHFRITNVALHNNGNGLFSFSGLLSRDIIVEGSHIYDNGIVGSDHVHNVYTEAADIVYQFNWFGPNKDGGKGSNIKDRSAGTVIRYNYIEGGAHLLDLVDAENNLATHDDPAYANTYVYGNILVNGPGSQGEGTDHGSATMIHFGGDTAISQYYRKNLYFYNNTLINIVDGGTQGRYRRVVFSLNTNGQTVYADNNIFFNKPYTEGKPFTQMSMLGSAGNGVFGPNWASPGWLKSATNATFTGTFTGENNFMDNTGNNPGLKSTAWGSLDAHLVSGASVINKGKTLTVPAGLLPLNHYVTHQQSQARPSNGALDFGAYEF